MTDITGGTGGGATINKQGGDAYGVSGAYSGAFGGAGQYGGGGGYYGGSSSSSADDIVGGASAAAAGGVMAQGGAGGVDQTSIGDITINT